MNLACANQIAKAVLYEGYMLYPYRPSSVKNRQRWNFGVLYPPSYSEAQAFAEPSSMNLECLLSGDEETLLELRIRFLHLQMRLARSSSEEPGNQPPEPWQEAVEREITLPNYRVQELCTTRVTRTFELAAQSHVSSENIGQVATTMERRQEAVNGAVEISAERIDERLFKVRVAVRNETASAGAPASERDAALMHSLVSTHIIAGLAKGEFISLLEPPEDLQEIAARCRNVGGWPVLVGEPGQRDTLLASPIILYDYPQIAPESAGDLFDGTEIDEILSLRIMTLTDEEKREIRQSDERARQILERTETMPAEQFMKLHGAVRGLRPLTVRRPQEDTP